MEKFIMTILVQDAACAADNCKRAKSWVADLVDIVDFTFISQSDENWDAECAAADIYYDAHNTHFHLPLNAKYAYVFSSDENDPTTVDGLAYTYPDGGMAIVVRPDEEDFKIYLRFRHELLHWLGYPADAMSYWYFAKCPSIMQTVFYALFGCHPFKNNEGNPSTKRVMNYQDQYYNMCYDLCRQNIPANWSNTDAPGWLIR